MRGVSLDMTNYRHRPLPTPLTARLSLTAAACLTAALTMAGCDSSGSDQATDEGPRSTPTTPSTTVTPASTQKPQVIAYAGGESPGVEVHTMADTARLKGAPDAFKEFIGGVAERNAARSECKDGFVGVTVAAIRTDGFATGGVNDCGGYAALWALVDGRWEEVGGTQEMWDCSILREYKVPSDIAGEHCYDYDAQKEHEYQQA